MGDRWDDQREQWVTRQELDRLRQRSRQKALSQAQFLEKPKPGMTYKMIEEEIARAKEIQELLAQTWSRPGLERFQRMQAEETERMALREELRRQQDGS